MDLYTSQKLLKNTTQNGMQESGINDSEETITESIKHVQEKLTTGCKSVNLSENETLKGSQLLRYTRS